LDFGINVYFGFEGVLGPSSGWTSLEFQGFTVLLIGGQPTPPTLPRHLPPGHKYPKLDLVSLCRSLELKVQLNWEKGAFLDSAGLGGTAMDADRTDVSSLTFGQVQSQNINKIIFMCR
jgi:hypothetical protein